MMSRNLFAVAASLVVSACVYQPPGYWRPYPQAYYPRAYPAAYPQPYPVSWNSQPTPGGAYTSLPLASTVPPAASNPPPAAAPLASDQPAEFVPADAGNDTPTEPINPRATFADETVDYGVPPTNTLHLHDFDAPTPTHIEGAHTITTRALQSMLNSPQRPVLVDVIGGQQSVSLPNAIWLRDAGVGRHMDDDVQAWFDLHLSQLTGHDKSRPLVFFCASRMCWLAHNATLRALDLGYTNVYWYRGGRDSWQAAGLPMSPVAPPPVNN
jgi:PQQ-dependent catabolism-associated CXXCW motif protein